MQRITIVGTAGSGKSTLARAIAARLNIPHIEMDALFWQPGWQPSEHVDFQQRLAVALAGDTWIVDGNYSTASSILVLPYVDTLIWLDYSLPLVLWRVIRRTLQRLGTHAELWNGNRESLRKALFSKDSIIAWAFTSWGPNRRHYRALLATTPYPQMTVIHLRSPRATRRWLRNLAAPQSSPVH